MPQSACYTAFTGYSPCQGGPWSLYTPLVDVWNEYRFFGTWVGSRVGLESSNFWIINHQVMGVNPKIWGKKKNKSSVLMTGFPWNKPSILGAVPPIFGNIHILSKKHLPSIMASIILFFIKIKMYDVIQKNPDHVSRSRSSVFLGWTQKNNVYTICYWDHLWGFLRWWFYFGSLHPRSLTARPWKGTIWRGM